MQIETLKEGERRFSCGWGDASGALDFPRSSGPFILENQDVGAGVRRAAQRARVRHVRAMPGSVLAFLQRNRWSPVQPWQPGPLSSLSCVSPAPSCRRLVLPAVLSGVNQAVPLAGNAGDWQGFPPGKGKRARVKEKHP